MRFSSYKTFLTFVHLFTLLQHYFDILQSATGKNNDENQLFYFQVKVNCDVLNSEQRVATPENI
jgi:hypothetical protein